MCYHFFPDNIICNFGWSGVDLFFVLSGFLITGRLLPFLDDKKILLKFYRNRFLRIVPLYFSFLILFFAGWFLLSSKETLDSFTFYNNHWWQFFLFVQNWTYIFNYPTIGIQLNHLWSIATEEQFYIIFPLFVILIKEKRKLLNTGIFFIVLILVTRCLYYYFFIVNDEYGRIYWNTFFRMDSLFIGFIMYLLFENKTVTNKSSLFTKIFAGPALLILIIGILISKTAGKNTIFVNTVGYTVIAIVYGGLLQLTLLKTNTLINYITSLNFLKFTGRISYGIYIFHWPLFLIGFTVLNKAFAYVSFTPGNSILHTINVLICFPTTYLISYLSFNYYERYFLKRKIRLP